MTVTRPCPQDAPVHMSPEPEGAPLQFVWERQYRVKPVMGSPGGPGPGPGPAAPQERPPDGGL